MPTIEQLNQKHPSWAEYAETHEDLEALYRGGVTFKKRLKSFLPQRPAEPATTYDLRKKESVYRNYVSAIISYFTSLLFSQRPRALAKVDGDDKPTPDPGDFYAGFQDDCDRAGTDVDALFKAVLTEALVHKTSWIRIHSPSESDAGPTPTNKAEFEDRKLGDCWLSRVCYSDVYDFDTDEKGTLLWAVLHRCESVRNGLEGSRDVVTETWEYLTPETTETFQISYKKDQRPSDRETVPSIGIVTHQIGQVPLVRLELPSELWIADRLASPQLAHFRLTNAHTYGLSRTCYAMPVFKLEDQESKPVFGSGYGIVIGKDEEMTWAAPPGEHYAALSNEIKAQKDELYRIAQSMALGVENNAAAIGRSGESKATDAESTKVVLLAYARYTKEAIERVYDLITKVRGDDFTWSIEGLEDFAADDLGNLVEIITKVDATGGIPSKTFNVQLKTKLAEALLPDMDQETKNKVREEIEANTKDPADAPDLDQLQADLMQKHFTDGEKPPGNKPPGGGKPPQAPPGGKPRGAPPAPPS